MIRRILPAVLLLAAACSRSSSPATGTAAPPAPTQGPAALPPGHVTPEDTTPKSSPRLMAGETYIRTYLQLFGGLDPLDAQKAAAGKDGSQLFDTWDSYLGALGMPDYRSDVPRLAQTNALMIATFERIGVALCDRALEHDRSMQPRLIYDFDMPAGNLAEPDFALRFDVLHRTFLNYPSSLAPTDRVNRFFQLYEDTVAAHTVLDAGASRFKPSEAGWAAVCYGLVRHPEFHLY
jgi:hypothetical protein